jgi:phosphatidylcholine synthase
VTGKVRALAWSAHLFTSLGLIAAAGMGVLLVRGGDDAFRGVFALMWLATLIDALDGSWAKRVRVTEVLPHFDGRRLDDLIDFQTYTSIPLLLIWRAGILPGGWAFLLLAPLLASAFGFSRRDAKTEDGYFLGFPSYWNVVAFYCYFLALPPLPAAVLISALTVLTFVPSRYLYPTQKGRLNFWTNALAGPWAFMLIWITATPGGKALTWASLYFPAFYLGASWWVSFFQRPFDRRPGAPAAMR